MGGSGQSGGEDSGGGGDGGFELRAGANSWVRLPLQQVGAGATGTGARRPRVTGHDTSSVLYCDCVLYMHSNGPNLFNLPPSPPVPTTTTVARSLPCPARLSPPGFRTQATTRTTTTLAARAFLQKPCLPSCLLVCDGGLHPRPVPRPLAHGIRARHASHSGQSHVPPGPSSRPCPEATALQALHCPFRTKAVARCDHHPGLRRGRIKFTRPPMIGEPADHACRYR